MPRHYNSYVLDEGGSKPIEPADFPWVEHASSLTIHVLGSGKRMSDFKPDTSSFGHVFLSVQRGGESKSIGFSAGNDFSSSHDNISFNDQLIYSNANSPTLVGDGGNFKSIINNIFAKIDLYETGKINPPNYNIFSFNCIDFVESLINESGGFIDLEGDPGKIEKKLSKIKFVSPLLIDMDGSGVQTIGVDAGVFFDFDGDGEKQATGWSGKNSGFLVHDRDGNGSIDSGAELFGENTPLPGGGIAKDGVMALTVHDSNQDGLINFKDDIWSSLKIWQDGNSNGISEAEEISGIEDRGIKEILLSFNENHQYDSQGNLHGATSQVVWSNENRTAVTDVWFKLASESGIGFSFLDAVPVEIVGVMPESMEAYHA